MLEQIVEQKEQAEILRERSRVLAEEILEDARKKAARILKKAEKEARDAERKAAAECERLTSELGEEAAVRAELEANKIRAGAGLECKRLRLARINGYLEELAEEGLQRLERLSGSEAEAVRSRQVEAALSQARSANALLRLSPDADAEKVLALAASVNPAVEVKVEREEALFPAEFILEEEGGRVRYTAVFREMFPLERERCFRAMYAELFGGAW